MSIDRTRLRVSRLRVSRRAFVAGSSVGVAGAALGLASGRIVAGQGTPSASPAATPAASPGASPSADPTGTRSIPHTFGATEITGVPERIVTVGLTDQDYVLALGIVPVAVREWFGEYPGALWPWAQEVADALGGVAPEVLPVAELDFEQIVALEPDLILGVSAGLTPEEYDSLAAIAPTVAQPAEYPPFGAPWPVITRTVGIALGYPDEAEALIPEITDAFAAVRAEYPQFGEATALLSAVVFDGTTWIYAEGPAPSFLVDLGFALPPAVEGLFAEPERAPVQLSEEQVGVLGEADVLVLGVYGEDGDALLEDPLFSTLDVATQGRIVVLPGDSELNGALTFGSVLSLPAALGEMAARLDAALDADPETEVEPVE